MKKQQLFVDFSQYRNGAEGFISFCEDCVRVPIYPIGSDVAEWCSLGALPSEISPKTNKSYDHIWIEQKRICREALAMKDGRFKYRLIVLCWMRGEGKSLLACLIQIWKFYVWPKQQIMLGANSKDQVKFVHYDIIRDIIYNSPRLLAAVGKKNIQEKEIRLKDSRGKVNSLIRSISSFSGIVSNITGFTFSEIFDMKNPKFFVQLFGSTRNMPNALGVIDSTVSDKKHVLYSLYTSFIDGKTEEIYFSYRHSLLGRMEDYWNPNMDDTQLNDYRVTFPFGEFERYFLNLWSAGSVRVFTEEMIEEIGILGCDGSVLNHSDITRALSEKTDLTNHKADLLQKGFTDSVAEMDEKIVQVKSRFDYMEGLYTIGDSVLGTAIPDVSVIERLETMFDTDFAVLGGADMADPMAVRSNARTILTVTLKGLPGSKSNPHLYLMENVNPEYIYILMFAASVQDHSLEQMKLLMDAVNNEYDMMDTLCGERWGMWDLTAWSEERFIHFEAIYPTYDRQREAFKELFGVVAKGRFKSPTVNIAGSKEEDIFREEASIFDHDTEKRWFGSPEKEEKYGIQDDFMYSVAWSIYGGRLLGADKFRSRRAQQSFGVLVDNPELMGNY